MNEQDVTVHPETTAFATRFFNQLRRYKQLLLAYWWIVLLALVLSVGIQWFLLRRSPASFLSTGRMIVNVKLSIPNANIYEEDFNYFFGTQVELMQSDSVVNRVNARLQAATPPLSPSPVNIKATLSPKTSIYNLTAVGGDPEYTRAYLEATMEEYVNLKRELLASASTATQTSMHEELRRISADLEKSKQDLINFQSSNGLALLTPTGENSAADYLSALTRQLAEHKSELELLKTLTLDQNLERQAGIFAPQTPGAHRPQLNTPTDQGSTRPSNLSTPQNNSTATAQPNSDTSSANNNNASPNDMPLNLGGFEVEYLQAKKQVVLLKAKRTELLDKKMSPTSQVILTLDDDIAHQESLLEIAKEQSQQQLKNRQHTLELQIQDLETQIQEWNLKALDVSKRLANFEVLKENVKRLQSMYDQNQTTLHALDVDKELHQESVRIFEPATPATPIPPKLGKQLSMAGLIGLVIGTGILLLLNQLDDRPGSLSELEEQFREPVLGQIPLVKARDGKGGLPILQIDDDRDAMVEAFSNLRSGLIFKESAQAHPKTILVTSAIPAEGKSMICANLAITFAQTGARVLLVDADLRRGVMHKYFSASPRPGLAEVLSERCAWSKAVIHGSIPNLDLLPCGATPRRPASLFVTQTHQLLKEMAGHYDYYLFDTPPVMVADDVSSLAPNVDGVIMVVRARFTSGRVAKAALNLLYLRKVNVIGLVLNAVPPNTSEYYHYRYKKYYTEDTVT